MSGGLRKLSPGTIGGQSAVATPSPAASSPLVKTIPPPAGFCIAFESVLVASTVTHAIANGITGTGAAITSQGAVWYRTPSGLSDYSIEFGQIFGETRVYGGGFLHAGNYGQQPIYPGAITEDPFHVHLLSDIGSGFGLGISRWPLIAGYATSSVIVTTGVGTPWSVTMPPTWGTGSGYFIMGFSGDGRFRLCRWNRAAEELSTSQALDYTVIAVVPPGIGYLRSLSLNPSTASEIWACGQSYGIATVWRYSSTGTRLQTTQINLGAGSPAMAWRIAGVGSQAFVATSDNRFFVVNPTGTVAEVTNCCTIDGETVSSWCGSNGPITGGPTTVTGGDDNRRWGSAQSYGGRIMLDRVGSYGDYVLMGATG